MNAHTEEQYIIRRQSTKPVPDSLKRLMNAKIERTPIERQCKAVVPEFLKRLMRVSAK